MIQAAVLTISDSVTAGTREDRSGPAVRERLEQLGWAVPAMEVLPDEADVIAVRLATLAGGNTAFRYLHHRRHRRGPARRDPGGHPRG